MTRLPMPAQYLLRVDDVCSTLHAERWPQVRELISEAGIHPILAVVPDNRDPELAVSASDPRFWRRMREMEAAGATVALHGYRHICTHEGRSLVPLHRHSEFAGVPLEQQCKWIAAGLANLRIHGLTPRLWVAPRHGFDRNTLHALRHAGISYLSDGLGRIPVRRSGILWIPQQLWRPESKAKGLWTICIHPNTMSAADIARLRAFLREHVTRFTAFEAVIRDFANSAPSLVERGREAFMTVRMMLRAAKARRGQLDQLSPSGAQAPARRQRPVA